MINNRYIRRLDSFKRSDGSEFKIGITNVGISEVTLISSMTNPEQMITKVIRTYSGNISTLDATEEEIKNAFDDQQKTKLNTPMEMMYFVFLVQNVSRAFTHQMVRTRLASYAQESMRFLGKKDTYFVHLSPGFPKELVDSYFDTCATAIKTYELLLENGTSSEQARGVLPTNILTSLFIGISLSSLKHVYEQRMCCQAQFGEWQDVLRKMRGSIELQCGSNISKLISAPYERGESCGYRASFDRPCVWRKDDNTVLKK